MPSLPSGAYSVSVEHPGFKQFIQKPVQVEVAQTIRVDVKLEMGAASESITVAADASMLQQDSSENSFSMSGDRMNDLR